MRRRRAAPLLTLAALAALGTAGCDRVAQATAAGRLQSRVARLTPAIERTVGLRFKQPPKIELRTPAEVRRFLERAFTESRAARELAGQERAYKLFGLLPPALHLRKILLDLLEDQVAGYYDPKTKVLYVVEGEEGGAFNLTIAHELVHALQDQYVDLDSIQRAEVDNDRTGAAQAAIEGHATYVSTLLVVGAKSIEEMAGGWNGLVTQIRDAAGDADGIGAAPAALREGLIFPYTAGLGLAAASVAARPGVRLLAEAPQSTEQVLHPAAYLSANPDRPTAVALPPIANARAVYSNVLGEFETRLVLAEGLRDTSRAARGATGWDGDRYAVVETAGGEGMVWLTVWDTPADAGEFADALAAGVAARYKAGSAGRLAREGTGAADPTGLAAPRTVSIRVTESGGRPVVLFVDAPAGAPPVTLDAAAATLRE